MMKTLDSEFYLALFASASEAMFIVEGQDNVIVDANSAAGTLLGGTRDDLIGKSAAGLFPPDLRAPIRNLLEELWDAAGHCGNCCRLQDLAGGEVRVRLSSTVVLHGNTARLALSATPVSELTNAAAEATRSSAEPAAEPVAQPAAEPVAEPVAEPQARPWAVQPRNLRILLAEDNKVNQTVALGMMRKLGHDGTAVDDGRHALMSLAGGDYDVVFMDLQMPELGGLETTRRIRSGEAGQRYRDIPIIAMTGHATRRDRQACLDAGMNGYIAKPISSDRIGEAIAALASPAATGDSRGQPFTAAKLVAQMNGDTELAAEILGVFREDTEDRLARIAMALRNYTFEAVIHEARAIEGGALNVCGEIIVNLSRELARAAKHKEQEMAESLVAELAAEVQTMTLD